MLPLHSSMWLHGFRKEYSQVVHSLPQDQTRFVNPESCRHCSSLSVSGVDVVGMEELGLSSPPLVEWAAARHFNPSQRVTTARPSLQSNLECFPNSTYHKMYQASAQSLKALNPATLLIA